MARTIRTDDELRAWWTQRFTTLAAEGDEEIRIASLITALRSLSQLDPTTMPLSRS